MYVSSYAILKGSYVVGFLIFKFPMQTSYFSHESSEEKKCTFSHLQLYHYIYQLRARYTLRDPEKKVG